MLADVLFAVFLVQDLADRVADGGGAAGSGGGFGFGEGDESIKGAVEVLVWLLYRIVGRGKMGCIRFHPVGPSSVGSGVLDAHFLESYA